LRCNPASTDGDLWLTGAIRRASDWEFWYRTEWKSFPCDGNQHRQMPPTKFTSSTWLSGLVAEMRALQIRELEPDESRHIEPAFADTFAAIAPTRSGC
jgi:hypothetical protein